MIAALFAAAAVAAAPAPMDPAQVKAIEAVAYDYQDREVATGSGVFARSRIPLAPAVGYQ